MNLPESIGETLVGMQRIERAIIEAMRERKVPLTAAHFSWNQGGGSLAELRDPVHMEVRFGHRQTSTDWLMVCLQDSADRIHRLDVRDEIQRIVEVLAPKS